MRQARLQINSRLRELARTIRQHDPDFLPHARHLTLKEIETLAIEADSTLMLFRVTEEGSYIFLVFPDGETDVVQEPGFTSDALSEMLVKFEDDAPVDGWVVRYYAYQSAMASRNERAARRARNSWFDTMDATLGALYERLMKTAHQRLKDRQKETGGISNRVVIVPNRGLAILPMHACWWDEGGERRYLLDEFVISYAPSLSVYKRCLEREKEGREKDKLFGVANPIPPGNLVFSEWECDEIERMLGSESCMFLWGDKATRDEVLRQSGQNHLLHFSCHGQYRIDAPLMSSLFLANEEALTLGEILESIDARKTWLTVLSACETGLVDFREIADEHYGLPIGFLYAGAPTVWSTLWMVNDLTTALLVVEAYKRLFDGKGKSKPEAIREAQIWLRDVTAEELRRRDIEFDGDSFAHPYYWAAMQCVGV
ncbi:MAG: CHAT domain-containing protein [Blastocatellia bacterium]|nr:CHAT domain-containing protein [Blastocatellia bacterium]